MSSILTVGSIPFEGTRSRSIPSLTRGGIMTRAGLPRLKPTLRCIDVGIGQACSLINP